MRASRQLDHTAGPISSRVDLGALIPGGGHGGFDLFTTVYGRPSCDLRVRHFGDLAKVELIPSEIARWSSFDARQKVDAAVIAAGYERVEIDPRGYRSGGMIDLARRSHDDGAALSRD